MKTLSTFETLGYTISNAVLAPDEIQSALDSLGSLSAERVGTRNLLALSWCRDIAGQLKTRLASYLTAENVAIQCNYFDKRADCNWLVSPHQDLAVPVKERIRHNQLGGWSEKEGVPFVQPPVELLEQLVAVRVHLDKCSSEDGPLRVFPRSHRHGRLSAGQIKELRAASPEVVCLAEAGDALVMRPLILHTSSKAAVPKRRRVLHFVFGPVSPGYGLQWPDFV